ncbi:hypothetical protein V498_06856, partial [Pseudogymnoascus sp. VKM F-4517 (FW-2822)]
MQCSLDALERTIEETNGEVGDLWNEGLRFLLMAKQHKSMGNRAARETQGDEGGTGLCYGADWCSDGSGDCASGSVKGELDVHVSMVCG